MMISEMSSEKPNRGRPRVIPDDATIRLFVGGFSPGVTTERGRQNAFYALRALAALSREKNDEGKPPPFAWLAAGDRARKTILAELGRIDDDRLLVSAAQHLCDAKPTTRRAVAWLRRLRGTGGDAPDAGQVASAVIRTVNQYAQDHPEIDNAQLYEGASIALREIGQSL